MKSIKIIALAIVVSFTMNLSSVSTPQAEASALTSGCMAPVFNGALCPIIAVAMVVIWIVKGNDLDYYGKFDADSTDEDFSEITETGFKQNWPELEMSAVDDGTSISMSTKDVCLLREGTVVSGETADKDYVVSVVSFNDNSSVLMAAQAVKKVRDCRNDERHNGDCLETTVRTKTVVNLTKPIEVVLTKKDEPVGYFKYQLPNCLTQN